ncbi:cyclodeaminase/cyclohydrolase family protein [Aerococcus vaginalis]
MRNAKITQFMDELGSDSPTPGGGAAAALNAALGVSSILMAVRISLKNKITVEEQSLIDELESHQQTFLELIDDDVEAFQSLSKAYRLPKTTTNERQQRTQAVQKTTLVAIEPQILLYQYAIAVLHLSERILPSVHPQIISDVAVGIQMLRSAYLSSVTNLYINIQSIKDSQLKVHYLSMIDHDKSEIIALADRLYETINQQIQSKI